MLYSRGGQERMTTQLEGLYMFRGASLPSFHKFLDVEKDLSQTALTQQISASQSAQGLPGALD